MENQFQIIILPSFCYLQHRMRSVNHRSCSLQCWLESRQILVILRSIFPGTFKIESVGETHCSQLWMNTFKCKGRKRPASSWITKELIALCKKKKTLYKIRARRTNNTATWEKYRKLKYSVKRLCSTARWMHINKLALDLWENDIVFGFYDLKFEEFLNFLELGPQELIMFTDKLYVKYPRTLMAFLFY